MKCFQAYSSGMLSGGGVFSGIYQLNPFGRILVKCLGEFFWGFPESIIVLVLFCSITLYRLEVNGMLSGVFHLLCRFEIHALLSGVFLWNAFWYIPIECFRMFLSEMLSDVFQWNAFRHIPADCFRAHSSGMLSDTEVFSSIYQSKLLGVFSSGMLWDAFQWNTFWRVPVECFRA